MSEQLSPCTPWQRFTSYLRRQSPWVIVILLLAVFLPAQFGFYRVMEWALGAAPVLPGGPDLDGAQVAAADQSRWVPLGIILSKGVAAVFFFFGGVGVVWWVMHRILPVLPTWAKRDFTSEFNYLPSTWKYGIYVACWLGLLFFFVFCLLAASLVQ